MKIQKRQSEIRQQLAAMVGKETLTEDETRSMTELDVEYGANEKKYRAALIAEDTERRDAKSDLETRGDREYSDLVNRFELRQVALHLDEGHVINGATAEIVSEMRSRGGYRGIPVPFEALVLEQRAGETVASGTPSPKITAPIIDRLFPQSVASTMGGQMISIAQGSEEYPLSASSVSAAWQSTETGAVGSASAYSTAQRTLSPNSTLGIQMKITRKALKQSGDGLEQAVRRDLNGCIASALDKAVFLGAGSGGEPSGLLVGSYSITSTSVAAAADWSAFRAAVVRFMGDNAAMGPGDVKLLIRPEVWSKMDGTVLTSTAYSEWDRMLRNIPASAIVMTTNALAAPTGSPLATKALLTTNAGGVPPFFVGLWGGVDLIRDPYSDAASGGLRLTGLVTADVSAGRAAQLQILTGVQT
ncbi:phage major capsid protein [Bradyrhizobium elkanii]|uniref:phage major capsid protein n=1 Tax=Bradyrhizobium elkanii TaxID=29448 RepID=UPI002711DF99|nr:phage major capsid protein [Bradyrhizobium elkanii]WLA36177.1 phage major capsid protein [Bradyrhizobium elkanii]